MSNYKGHLAGGFAAYCILFFMIIGVAVSLVTQCEWLLFTLAGALFPDIDIKSKGQKYFYHIVLLIFIILASKGQFKTLSCFSFLIITPMLVRHRGIFHNFWFILIAPAIGWIVIAILFPALSRPLFFDTLFFIAGGVSHLFLDRGFGFVAGRRRR